MTKAETVGYIIADLFRHTGNNGMFAPLTPALRERLDDCPEAVRWLDRRCPVCDAELFLLENSEETAQWCSEERSHFELERVSFGEQPDGKYAQQLSIRLLF